MRWRRRGKKLVLIRWLRRFQLHGQSMGCFNELENCIAQHLSSRTENLRMKNSPRSRNGASTSTSHYPPLYHHPQQQQQQQQQYYHQQISKAKRSKSMDDFGAHMVFEQSSRVHRNNVRNGNGYQQQQQRSPSQMGKRSPSQNGLSARNNNHHPTQPQHKNQMRYSVDNLLEIDTSYYNNYQVSVRRNERNCETHKVN